MATFSTTAVSSATPARYLHAGDMSMVVQASISATISSGDVWAMMKIPNGAQILETTLTFSGLGGGNYTVQLGDGNSAGRYLDSLSTGSTTSTNRMTQAAGLGYSYSAEDTIDLTWSTATTASLTGTVRLMVRYRLDQTTT